MMRLIGLDIGTTGCKAHIFDQNGRLLGSASREYAVDIPHPDWAEQDAEKVWQLAQEALREALELAGPSGEVAGVGLSVQGEAITPVDENGSAMRPTILGMDTRTEEQNAWLREKFGAKRLFHMTGMPVHTINTLPKLLWLKQYEPETWEQAHQFLLYEDFIIRKMTGRAVTSECLASRTQLYDLHQGAWSSEILKAIGLSEERLATVAPSGTAVGPMLPELAASLGLDGTPQVVTGGHDQACGALGVGLTEPGLAMVSTGTAEVVEVALGTPTVNEHLYQGNISVYRHVVPGLYLAMTLNQSGGMMLRWFRDALCQKDVEVAAENDQDAYDLLLAEASPEPSPLIVLPHFAGSGTPWFDTRSKGAILGMTFATTKEDLAKAIIEGLTLELRVNLDLLKEGGIEISELRAIGGGARSALWLQMKADINGIQVAVPVVTEAAGLGAAILAGVGAGIFDSAAQAANSMLQIEQRYQPDAARKALFDERFKLYEEVYPAVTSISHRL
jgi:xylulokinase